MHRYLTLPLLPISHCLFLLLANPQPLPGEESLSIDRFDVSSIDEVEPSRRTLWTLEYNFTGPLLKSSLFSGMRLSTVGEGSKIDDFLFLFHGDTPSYYDSTTKAGRSSFPIEAELLRLHKSLKKQGVGLLVVQPFCSKSDWHSLYGSSSSDYRATGLVIEIQGFYRTLCDRLRRECGLHIHSFSGAGRVDRALHAALSSKDETFALLRSGILRSWTASDSMVNNSYSREDKEKHTSIMAVSWAEFLLDHPSVPVTLIYDRSGEYPYMQGITLDVMRFYQDLEEHGEIRVEPNVRIIENSGVSRTVIANQSSVLGKLKAWEGKRKVVYLNSAESHLTTFLGQIANSYLKNREFLMEQQ